MDEYPMDYDGNGEIDAGDMTIWQMYEDSARISREYDEYYKTDGSESSSGGSYTNKNQDAARQEQIRILADQIRRDQPRVKREIAKKGMRDLGIQILFFFLIVFGLAFLGMMLSH